MHVRLAVAAAVLAWSGGMAVAQPPAVPPGTWWDVPLVVEEVGLTDDQRSTLAKVTRRHVRALADLRAAVARAEIDLQEVSDRDPLPLQEVRQAFTALQASRTRLEQERFELVLSVRGILEPEQWRRLQRFARERVQDGRDERFDQEGREPRPQRPPGRQGGTEPRLPAPPR